MFSKLLLYTFCVVGIYAVLFASIPNDFFRADMESSAGYDHAIAERFEVANVTLYEWAGNDSMTYPYSSYWDSGEWGAGLPEGHYIEVWWGLDTTQPPAGPVSLEVRHVTQTLFWVNLIHRLEWRARNDYSWRGMYGDQYHIWSPAILEGAWDAAANGSVFYVDCIHFSTSVIVEYNQTTYGNITAAWNAGELAYFLSYETDWNATQLSAFTVLSSLLTFQSPNLGVPGTAGTILNLSIAIPFWCIVAILVIKLIQSIIPFISGIDE